MKFIVTENQLGRVEGYDKAEKMFFRYWDKVGPKVDESFFQLFGFTPMGLEVGGFMLRRNDVYRMIRKWYGGDEAKFKTIELLNKQNYSINSCGGYNFNFDIVDYEIDDDIGEIFIDVKPDVKNGTVILLMIGGEEQNLCDALNNDDYGWEIEGEIADCAYELLHDKITNTTGYEIGINKLILD
jgi:hypothetical protein